MASPIGQDMFVFPLGLQAKTRDFPTVTVLIAIVTTIYSIFSFDAVDSIRKIELRDPTVMVRMQKQKALSLAACSLSKFSKEDCEILADVVEPSGVESPDVFLDRVLDRVRDTHVAEAAKKTSNAEAKESEDRDTVGAASLADRRRAEDIARYVLATEPWRKPSAAVRGLREYTQFELALVDEEASLLQSARQNDLLTKGNFSFKTLARSLFLHEGWMHLIGNMLFFLLFAIPLESRIGGLGLALIYFIGGAFGMTVDLAMTSEVARPLLGASACITAVAAAFMVAFWSFYVRVWASAFFVFNHVVRIPTWMFFALFVVMQDLAGALSAQHDGVAHLAHLGGFGIGILLGAIATQLKVVPKPFHFPFELDLFLRSRAEVDFDKRLGILREILFYNPRNTEALVESWNVIERLKTTSWEEIPRSAKIFLAEHYCELLIHLQSADEIRAAELLKRIEIGAWPSSTWIPRQELVRMMGVVRDFELGSKTEEAVLLAKALMEADPDSHRTQALRMLVKKGVERKPREIGDGSISTIKAASGH